MAEKMIIEFYQGNSRMPIATLLVRHHGEDPASAALTVVGFLLSVKSATTSNYVDAGDLVSRFVLWEGEISSSSASSPYLNTSFCTPAAKPTYQLVRLRTIGGEVQVEIVTDEYTTNQELEDATAILASASIPTVIATQSALK